MKHSLLYKAIAKTEASKIVYRLLFLLLAEHKEGQELVINIAYAAKHLDLHPSYVHRGIAQLVRLGILTMDKFGPIKLYKINEKFKGYKNTIQVEGLNDD